MNDNRFDLPLIAVDVVPLRFTGTQLQVGVVRREFEPFAGCLALPGVLLGVGESLVDAATRALATKGGLTASAIKHLAQVETFDGPLRDPRHAAISVAYLAVVDSVPGGAPASTVQTVKETAGGVRGGDGPVPSGGDGSGKKPVLARGAVSGEGSVPTGGAGGGENPVLVADPNTWWEACRDHTSLAFDHDSIVAAALDACRVRLWGDVPLTRALLGESFPTSAATALITVLTGEVPDHGNLNRLLKRNSCLAATTTQTGGRGRPATVWSWV